MSQELWPKEIVGSLPSRNILCTRDTLVCVESVGKVSSLFRNFSTWNMASFGNMKLRNLGDFFARGASVDGAWEGWCRGWNSYRAKYVTCKNARMTPFFHVVFLAIALNYAIEYPHLKGECTFFERLEKTSVFCLILYYALV